MGEDENVPEMTVVMAARRLHSCHGLTPRGSQAVFPLGGLAGGQATSRQDSVPQGCRTEGPTSLSLKEAAPQHRGTAVTRNPLSLPSLPSRLGLEGRVLSPGHTVTDP